jgi:DsbC/DsbD-like thiol-disulfide interchange protein
MINGDGTKRGRRSCCSVRLGLWLAAVVAFTILAVVAATAAKSSHGDVVVKGDAVTVKVSLSNARASSGQQLGVAVDFEVAPGWHIYGGPLPEGYTPTSVKFDDDIVASQMLQMPKPALVKFETIGETFPVYQGSFKAVGNLLLKQKLAPGTQKIAGTIEFQECNDLECKIPQSARFEIPITIDQTVSAAPKNQRFP